MAIKPTPFAPGLFAPRRDLIDGTIRRAAWSSGAEIRTGLSCAELLRNRAGRVTGLRLVNREGAETEIAADVVFGADGRSSTVAQLAGANVTSSAPHRSAVLYSYLSGLPNEGYRWYFANQAAAGLIPTNDGQHCLFVACPPGNLSKLCAHGAEQGIAEVLQIWEPELTAELRGSARLARPKRFPGQSGFMRDCAGSGWALVGDAGLFKDPLTSHGMTSAFLDAHRLSTALTSSDWDATEYQIARDAHASPLLQLSDKIASFDWSLPDLKAMHLALNAQMKRESAEILAGDRITLRTVFRDTRSSRQICLIDLPSTKCARLIFAIVSTTNIP